MTLRVTLASFLVLVVVNASNLPQSEADLLARNADIPVISDGDMTWLQYGASGSEEPNALVTVSTFEVGINAARGKPTAVIEAVKCAGGIEVKEVLVKGHHTCPNVTSYDPRSGQMGTVDIEVDFTATS